MLKARSHTKQSELTSGAGGTNGTADKLLPGKTTKKQPSKQAEKILKLEEVAHIPRDVIRNWLSCWFPWPKNQPKHDGSLCHISEPLGLGTEG